MRGAQVGVGFLAILVALSVFPIRRMTAPHWYISVTSADGSPAGNVLIREEANDYSCGSGEQEETALSGVDGRVEFAPKYIRTTLAHCIFRTLESAATGVHASFGRNTWAFPIGEDAYILDKNGKIYSWNGHPGVLHSQLVLKR